MIPTTYTVIHPDAGAIASGLNAVEAMTILLNSGDRSAEVRSDGAGWQLFTACGGSQMQPTNAAVGYSTADTRAEAEWEIAPRVLMAIRTAVRPRDWTDLDYMTDAEHAALVADAEEAE